MERIICRCTPLFIISFACVLFCVLPAVSQEAAISDSLLKLAIFKPHTAVYDQPKGHIIGYIDRGRVIRLLASDGMWLNFTTYDYEYGWLRWENTQTLAEWANSPPFDSLQIMIIAWENAVKKLDGKIDSSLQKILELEGKISAGEIELSVGIAKIQREGDHIEDCFRELHQIDKIPALNDAVKALDGKRWAIDYGLRYLMIFLQGGNEEDGAMAGKYFETAEDYVYHYAQAMFRLKSTYELYDNSLQMEE